MIDDHWFDALNKRLTQSAPRRVILSAVTALSIIQHLGASAGAGKGGKQRGSGKGGGGNHGNKGNGKGNGNIKPKPPKPSDSCATNFQTKRDRKHCRFIRRQCDGDDPRDFCIVESFIGHVGEKVARCCSALSPKCCGKKCCDPDAKCCGGSCCGSAATSEFQCCNGLCINTKISGENCGACGNACRDDQVCRDGKCSCPATCPHGQNCLNGSGEACGPDDTNCRCWCGPNFKYCENINGGVCASPNAVC